MICEKCKRNEANVHISKNINGKATELHLCENCARETGELHSINQFFGDFFESVLPVRVRRVAFMPASRVHENQYAGCEDCIEDIPSYRPPELASMPDQSVNREAAIIELRLALKEAVEKEEFEQAAKIRDEIKKLEG